MNQKNYYKILGVNEQASINEIKKAYHSLAFQYHPDRNPSDKSAEKKFRNIAEAYEVLKDEKLRNEYDYYYGTVDSSNQNPILIYIGTIIFIILMIVIYIAYFLVPIIQTILNAGIFGYMIYLKTSEYLSRESYSRKEYLALDLSLKFIAFIFTLSIAYFIHNSTPAQRAGYPLTKSRSNRTSHRPCAKLVPSRLKK